MVDFRCLQAALTVYEVEALEAVKNLVAKFQTLCIQVQNRTKDDVKKHWQMILLHEGLVWSWSRTRL